MFVFLIIFFANSAGAMDFSRTYNGVRGLPRDPIDILDRALVTTRNYWSSPFVSDCANFTKWYNKRTDDDITRIILRIACLDAYVKRNFAENKFDGTLRQDIKQINHDFINFKATTNKAIDENYRNIDRVKKQVKNREDTIINALYNISGSVSGLDKFGKSDFDLTRVLQMLDNHLFEFSNRFKGDIRITSPKFQNSFDTFSQAMTTSIANVTFLNRLFTNLHKTNNESDVVKVLKLIDGHLSELSSRFKGEFHTSSPKFQGSFDLFVRAMTSSIANATFLNDLFSYQPNSANGFWSWLEDLVNGIENAITKALISFVNQLLEPLVELMTSLLDHLGKNLEVILTFIIEVLYKMLPTLEKTIDILLEFIQKLTVVIKNLFIKLETKFLLFEYLFIIALATYYSNSIYVSLVAVIPILILFGIERESPSILLSIGL